MEQHVCLAVVCAQGGHAACMHASLARCKPWHACRACRVWRACVRAAVLACRYEIPVDYLAKWMADQAQVYTQVRRPRHAAGPHAPG